MSTKQTGVQLIAQERSEQIEKHGFDPKWDREVNDSGQMKQFAIFALTGNEEHVPFGFRAGFINNVRRKSEIERLVIAGACIAAEIDRLKSQEVNR